MKIRLLSAAVLTAAALSLSACTVPEDYDASASDSVEKDVDDAAKDKAKSADTSKPGMDDVKIDKCMVDPTTKFPSAKLTITNNSSKTSNYSVSVEFTDAGGTRLDEGLAATNNLAPEQSSKQAAQALTEASGTVKCKITDVTRYAS